MGGGDYYQIGQCHLQRPLYKNKGILDINTHIKYK